MFNTEVVPNVKLIFKDYKEIPYGEWSRYAHVVRYGTGLHDFIEICLYHEPLENEEYAGAYTLQIFQGDNVILCETVDMGDVV